MDSGLDADDVVRFKEDRIIKLYNKVWQVLSDKRKISVEAAKLRFEIRQLWSEDFDGHTESNYIYDWSTDGDQAADWATFHMQPITKFEIVGVYGFHTGNVGVAINYIKVWINNTKIREYFGHEIAAALNDVYVFDDPFYITRTQNWRMEPNTTVGSATTRAFPKGWIIRAP